MTNKKAELKPTRAKKPVGFAYLIGRLDHVLNKRLRDVLGEFGLTATQYTALSVFSTHGQLSNAQLAERSMITPQAANEMVKTMEQRGWIERQPAANHGRIIHIRMTDAGDLLLKQCDATVAILEMKMLEEFERDERVTLHGQLKSVLRILNAMAVDT